MVTFTINIPQMLIYIPYMDPMGTCASQWFGPHMTAVSHKLGGVQVRPVEDMWLDQCFLTVGHAKRIYVSWWQLKSWNGRFAQDFYGKIWGWRFFQWVYWGSTDYCFNFLKTIRPPFDAKWHPFRWVSWATEHSLGHSWSHVVLIGNVDFWEMVGS